MEFMIMVAIPTNVTETAPEAPVVETKKKKGKKAEAVTVPTPEGTTPEVKAPAEPKAPTQRLKIFQGLSAAPMTGRAVAEMLGSKSIPMILKDEGVCPTPRIERVWITGNKGTSYRLTAAGQADLEAGLVDEKAAPASPHLGWAGEPSGKPVGPTAEEKAAAKAKKAADAAAKKAATTVPTEAPTAS